MITDLEPLFKLCLMLSLLLLDLEFSLSDALAIFILWFTQFIFASLRTEVTVIYFAWSALEFAWLVWKVKAQGQYPKALEAFWHLLPVLRGSAVSKVGR